MQPYYQDEWVTLCHSMCEAVLPVLEAGSVDLVLTDPPYAEQTHAGARTGTHNAPVKLLNFASFSDAELRLAFDAIGRVARGWVVSFMDWRHIHGFEAMPPEYLRFVRFGVWVKPNGAPQFTGDRPATGWEAIAIVHREGGKMKWNGGGRHAVWTVNKAHQDSYYGDHPTVKPLPLVSSLVKLFSNPGDLILDPFAGSGTTLLAAKNLGRKAIGIECEERYCEIAAMRLSQSVMNFEPV